MLDDLNQGQDTKETNQDTEPEFDFDKLWEGEDIEDDDANQGDDSNDTNADSDDDDDSDEGDEGSEGEGNNSTEGGEGNEGGEGTEGTESDEDYELEVKFNKTPIKLKKEDAVRYAQIGMASEKALEQRDAYKSKLDRLESAAKSSGMDLDTFIQSVEAKAVEIEIDKEFDTLRQDKKYEGVSDEFLKELATSKCNEKRKSTYIEQRVQADTQAESSNQKIHEQITRFSIVHPEVDIDHLRDVLTDDMYALMDKGLTLLEAYDAVKQKEVQEKLKDQESQLKASKKNEENKKRNMGNTSSVGDGKGKDPLLDILFSE